MEMLIDTREEVGFDLTATGFSDIRQCVYTLLRTMVGEAPLNRRLGLSSDILDSPITNSGKLYEAVLFALEDYEPRVKVKSIEGIPDGDSGRFYVKVLLDVKEVEDELFPESR